MLDLFKGQLSWTDLTQEMAYKDLLLLRDIRVERKTKEGASLEDAISEMHNS